MDTDGTPDSSEHLFLQKSVILFTPAKTHIQKQFAFYSRSSVLVSVSNKLGIIFRYVLSLTINV